jgi:hypothetical protein
LSQNDADVKAPAPEARFHFVSRDLRLEFTGGAEYVSTQVEMFRGAIRKVLGYPEVPPPSSHMPASRGPSAPTQASNAAIPSANTADSAGRQALDEFLRRVRTRVGRGALQERILLFSFYLIEVKGRSEVGTEDINFCFDLLGLERPKSLANTLGIMKRNQGMLESGSRRGTYILTPKGQKQVEKLLVD